MKFSPFNPILFGNARFAEFPMMFSTNDNIMIECFKENEEELPPLSLISGNGEASSLTWNCIQIGEGNVVFYILRGIEPGKYELSVGELMSNPIIVTDDEDLLSNTVLLQYGNNGNRTRSDMVSKINRDIYFFECRIPGGFKDSDWEFGVDNEQFETENSDIVELYSVDTTSKKLTIGTSAGVPLWLGEIVSRALSCDLVYIDGERFSRVSNSVPQAIESDGDSFVYKVMLRQFTATSSRDLKQEIINRISIRRTPTNLRRLSTGFRKV